VIPSLRLCGIWVYFYSSIRSLYFVENIHSFLLYDKQFILHVDKSEPEVPVPLPCGPRLPLCLFSIKLSSESDKVDLTSSSVDINIGEFDTNAPLSVVQLISDEECNDDWSSKVAFEECLGIWLASNRPQSDVELGDEAEDVERETDPRSGGTEHGSERQVVSGAASSSPSLSESDMGKADTSPREEVGQTGQGEEPGEDSPSILSLVDVCKTAEKEYDNQYNPRSTFLINLGADRWSHTVCAKSLNGTGGGESAGVGHGDNRDGDYSVKDGWENLDPGELEGQDKW